MMSLLTLTVLVSFFVGTQGQVACSALLGSGCAIVDGGGSATYTDATHGVQECDTALFLNSGLTSGALLCSGLEASAFIQLETTNTQCDTFVNDDSTCISWLSSCCTAPTASPTMAPSKSPTTVPSNAPTTVPTFSPSDAPSVSPTSTSPTSSPETTPIATDGATTSTILDLGLSDPAFAGAASGCGVAALLIAFVVYRRVTRKKDEKPAEGKANAVVNKKGEVVRATDTNIFDWEKHIDKKSGEVYFFNPKTGESRWDPPEVVTTGNDIAKAPNLKV